MPWQGAENPSIQLGILKSCLSEKDIEVDSLYANLIFAKALGLDRYADLCGSLWYPFVREWLFNAFMTDSDKVDYSTLVQLMDVFGNNPITKHADIKDRHGSILTPQAELHRHRDPDGHDMNAVSYFRELKSSVIPQYYDTLFTNVDFGKYSVIGFTCGFSQLVPSLSFSAAIKERFPQPQIVFGGSAVQGTTGNALLKHFPQVDLVCPGDGEEVIVSIATGDLDKIDTDNSYLLEHSPAPDYDDYFSQLAHIGNTEIYDGTIPYESSRGCLWAAKRPCTFCALNGTDLRVRSKSIGKILADIRTLSRRYAPRQIAFTDNLVNVRHQKELFQVLGDDPLDSSFFLEVKPNLSYDELALVHRAGVTDLQAGIEALSTPIQTLLHKGTTLEGCLGFLRNCADLDINVCYNHLVGIPGESAGQYQEILELIPTIIHLPPPSIPLTPISLQRYSPYWRDPKAFGIIDVIPASQYNLIYPPAIASDFAFIFDFSLDLPSDFNADYINSLVNLTLAWRTEYSQP